MSSNNLAYFIDKYNLDINVRMPVYVPAAGRLELANLFSELNFKVGAEIGVQYGNYTELLCKTIPGLKLYGIDSWTAYKGYVDIRGSQDQSKHDQNYERARERTAAYDCTLIKKYSTDASLDFANQSLDFVYIDGNHDFLHCTEDIAYWLPKIRVGGIIAGHDYARINNSHLRLHCKDVVRGWTAAYGINPWFVLTKDNSPNWMWFIKE